MADSSNATLVANYRRRFGFTEASLETAPAPDLKLVVVIPVHNETDLIASLNSLLQCERPSSAVEVLLIVNASARDCPSIHAQNQECIEDASSWILRHNDPKLRFHLQHFPDLPKKHAGVGLARKIGMDEAAYRLSAANHLDDGIIVCYDADCSCQPSFLVENTEHFERNPKSAACSTYFEHPLAGSLPAELYEAAAAYELHLRYYVEALRSVAFPYAYHSIGSSMSVRARDYLLQGGMNRKKAGEDFYFLQKLMISSRISELNTTTVYPSPRPSQRVPFGTGRAIQCVLDGQEQTSYPFGAFVEIGALVSQISRLETVPGAMPELLLCNLPASIRTFLETNGLREATEEIAGNVRNAAQFKKRFWQWFNGFRCMKYLNWASESDYPRAVIRTVASEPVLLKRVNLPLEPPADLLTLLNAYRKHQRTFKISEGSQSFTKRELSISLANKPQIQTLPKKNPSNRVIRG